MIRFSTFLTIALAIVYLGCQDDAATKSKVYNPNGDSELALLMRDMFDDGMAIKTHLLEGDAAKVRIDYERIMSAHATQPEKVATPEYAAFAENYFNFVEAFDKADPAYKAEVYQVMVTSCVNCHQQFCTGPIRKINKLYLTDEELEKYAVVVGGR